MFLFQRSDINLRNQWSNYTNWAYTNAIPEDVTPAPATGTFINPCDIITQTVLNLYYFFQSYATTPRHATVVVPATTISQFAVGQTITVTYDASNTITGTISSIIGTSIIFLVTGVVTNASPVTIYDNNSTSSPYLAGSEYSNFFLVNTPPFNYAGQNYIVQTATCTFQGALPAALAIISFQLIDNTTGTTYNPISSNTLAPAAPLTTLTYTYDDCFIENGDAFTLAFHSNHLVDWNSVNVSPGPSVRYRGTITGYPVSYTSGVVTVNADLPTIGPGMEPSGTPSGLFITRDYNVENQREILQQLGILLNGSYSENLLESGVYN
jgi:hypothetical protein